jgi:hypothetical protein
MSLFLEEINRLSELHYRNCGEYAQIVSRLFGGYRRARKLEEVPFVPVDIFKELELKSVPQEDVFKTLTSSGTLGKQSKIFLNKENSHNQIRALKELFQEQFGSARVPMLILDSQEQMMSSASANARKAAVIGFSLFASDRIFILKDNSEIDWDKLNAYLTTNKPRNVVLFGFTFLLWTHLITNNRLNRAFKLPNGAILHGGGWKKLEGIGVSKSEFKQEMGRVTGVDRVIDYYGMAEQAGSIFFECESGYFHTSNYSDLIIRSPYSLLPLAFGETGLVQVISNLPTSYPGHSILTQDLGTIHGEGDCSCKRPGRYFVIEGRMPTSQIRGCSDVGL